MDSKVDAYLARAAKWQKEMMQLRKIILSCGLTEALKWGKPCYDYEGKNIVVIQGFKEYLAVLFMNGYLLSDPDGVLVKMGENTTVGRQMRFADTKEVVKLAPVLKAYIYEAIELEKSGVKPAPKEKKELEIPEELQKKFKTDSKFKAAFKALTPGRQRGYIFHFSQAKQSKTREARIEKYVQQIMKGKGLTE